MNKTATTYISLGSNLGDRLNHLQDAVFHISSRIGEVVRISHIYETPAWGFDGDYFYNVCLEARTQRSPQELLEQLLQIEILLGRERKAGPGYASRTIDLDILYYDREIFHSDTLTIPHPNLAKRRFVLKPLADIAPQFYHPEINKDTRNLLQECKDKSDIQ